MALYSNYFFLKNTILFIQKGTCIYVNRWKLMSRKKFLLYVTELTFVIRTFNITNSFKTLVIPPDYIFVKTILLILRPVPIYSLAIQRRPVYHVLMFCQNEYNV